MVIQHKFKLGEPVFLLINNKVVTKRVFGILFEKSGIIYKLQDPDNLYFLEEKLFTSKQELLNSL